MSGAHDAGGVMHAQTHVTFLDQIGFASVHAHAHPNRNLIWPGVASESALGSDRGCDSIGSASKGEKERIALRIDLVAVMLVDRCTQERPALCQHICVALAQEVE
jgi:hypothetical protein